MWHVGYMTRPDHKPLPITADHLHGITITEALFCEIFFSVLRKLNYYANMEELQIVVAVFFGRVFKF